VIGRVSENLVPCAINLYKIRRADGPARDLFLSVQRQKDQYQGIWIVSPDGKVLAGHHDIQSHATWSQEVLDTIDAGLRAYGPVDPRSVKKVEPLPFRGQGVPADGRVTLAVYTRYMHNGRPDGPAVIDSVTLTSEQLAALFPAKGQTADEWTIPDDVARQFSRLLSPSSDQSTMPRPDEVTDVQWKGRVDGRNGDSWTLAYEGTLSTAHVYEGKTSYGRMTVRGVGQWDAVSGQPQAIWLVGEGTHRGAPPYDSPRETGAVVRWSLSSDAGAAR
jgi:hypothetical protein